VVQAGLPEALSRPPNGPQARQVAENFRRVLKKAPLRSPLGEWMAAHRAELEALFREGEPDWAKMAEAFGKAGLCEESDRKPTAESAQRTWRMVRRRG
jgi:hypothetical protein